MSCVLRTKSYWRSTTRLVRLGILSATALSLMTTIWQSGQVTQHIFAYQNQYDGDDVQPGSTVRHVNNRTRANPIARSALLPRTSRLQFAAPCRVSCALPPWMQRYLDWHTATLQGVQSTSNSLPSDWRQHKLLIMRCLEQDRCGGTADRLKSLPVYLAVAAKTKRLLFLRWTRPFRIEEFLIPGEALNWTVPDTLSGLLLHDDSMNKNYSRLVYGGKALHQLVRAAHNSKHWLIEGAAQMAGGDLFRKVVESFWKDDSNSSLISDPHIFFHDMFLTLFRPSPALHRLVEYQLEMLDLWPNQFVTAHIRAKYPGEPYRETWNVSLLEPTITNAIDCAISLVSSDLTVQAASPKRFPVYVASDTLVSLQAAQVYGRSSRAPQGIRVVSYLDIPTEGDESNMISSGTATASTPPIPMIPHQDPPHLNFAHEENPSAFFSIFADLFIMSQSRCVSFGAGGFGRFGSLVSFNASCQVAHSTRGKRNQCGNAPAG